MTIRDWSKTAANNGSGAPGINWAEGTMLPPDINDSAREMMAQVAKWRDDFQGSLTTTGSVNTYSLTTNAVYTALADGIMLKVRVNITNTGAATLNVDGLGAKALRKPGASADVALVAGDMVAGADYFITYGTAYNSAAGGWLVTDPTTLDGANLAASSVATSALAANSVTLAKFVRTGTAGQALISGGGGADAGYQPVAARAWVKFDGTTGTISQSYNVSSVTRNSAGDYTINFSTALANANYVVVGSIGPVPNGTGLFGVMENSGTARSTSLVRIFVAANAGVGTDFTNIQIAIFGN